MIANYAPATRGIVTMDSTTRNAVYLRMQKSLASTARIRMEMAGMEDILKSMEPSIVKAFLLDMRLMILSLIPMQVSALFEI